MVLANNIGEELEEETHHQQSNVHTVHIGIGGDDDFVVAQVVDALLNVERRLQEVELLVLIDKCFALAIAVLGLTTQREDRLGLHIPRGGNRAARRQTLRDENH